MYTLCSVVDFSLSHEAIEEIFLVETLRRAAEEVMVERLNLLSQISADKAQV